MNFLKIVGIPEPQARPRTFSRGGRIVTFSPKSNWYQIVYAGALEKRPKAPILGPIDLQARFWFPRPKSAKKDAFWKISRPDLDNLLKAIKDALTEAQWWVDDSQVSRIMMEKRYVDGGYGKEPGVDIWVSGLNEKATAENPE